MRGLAIALLVSACGGSGLRLTQIDHSVQKPSNVAVYFTVDTADGDPVPGLKTDAFRIYEDDRLVSAFESKQTILNPEVIAAHYTLLLVDMSGSVAQSGDLPTIVAAAQTFSARVGKYQKVAVYAFDGSKEIHKISDFSASGDAVTSGAERLDSFKSKDPSTNLNGAVLQGLLALDRQVARNDAPLRFGTLVVFTDGTDRAARVKHEDMDLLLDDTPHDIVVIGVGAEIDQGELESIGRSGAIITKNRAEIQQAFDQAAARIEAMSQRYYLLGYCSPARAGRHKVTIEAVANGKSGTLEYEFDANGFKPECDPNRPPRFNVKRPRPVTADR